MARNTWFGLLGLAAFVLACELLLRALPVATSTATGYHLDPLIVTYPPHHRWTMSTGWALHNPQRLLSNNAGFVAHRDFEPGSGAVALIGDSLAEAAMLDAADRPGVQLERALGGRPVFTMASPGSALLDYAERIRLAQARYGVRDVVLLMERGDVRQSLCGSGQVQGPCVDRQSLTLRTEIQPPPGLAKRILRHSALAQYIFGQLKFDPARLLRQAMAGAKPPAHPTVQPPAHAPSGPAAASFAAASQPDPQATLTASAAKLTDTTDPASWSPPPELDAVIHAFFDRIRGRVAGRLVIVIDSHRAELYSGQSIADPARDRFIAQARAAGATVVDAAPIYRQHHARARLTFDVGPYDAHLNPLGVSLLMQAAAGALGATP